MGEFIPVEVQTVQRYRRPCRIVRAGQSAALSIGNPDIITEKLRKVVKDLKNSFKLVSKNIFKK